MSDLDVTTPPVTRTQIVRFAGAAGDFNPMHHDEPFAQAAGQDSVFAMGQLTAAILGDAVAAWLGRDRLAGYGVRFKAKVLPGDDLVLTGAPVDGEPGRYELQAAKADGGEVVLTGWATTRA
ncbi:MaoC family dehydratase N-terminal domain-containing protein [Paraconexibacter antarcticus]|uniref:MaoC family dehydratase N-terminal domain-containing protein n=1 Tax=Paraconexibacter antarcticus TaxID=2949664 RepID=A0ABY5DSA0_9ACTN|nr:MaoC/PaaZ C-terminal domain-containing protein [Paraconexibacter antarcticus]UTI63612.1 MaoC family dehydratase N-terminal domain-containing protein [Paraconexibacter antarcticus]